MHIGAIMVFDPPPDGRPPSQEELCEHLVRRLGQLPRYGQRLSEPHTGGMSWPEWEEDPAFDLAGTSPVRQFPPREGHEELAEWSSGFFSQRLDRHRPLWEMAARRGTRRRSLGARHQDAPLDGRWRRLGRCGPPAARHDSGRGPPASLRRGGEWRAPSPVQAIARRPHLTRVHPARWPLAHAWAGLLPVESMVHAVQMGTHGALHPREALSNARSAVDVDRARGAARGAPARVSTCRSEHGAGSRSCASRWRTSRRSRALSAARSTTSCSPSPPVG